MVVWKTLRDLFQMLFFEGLDLRQWALVLLMAAPWSVFQFLMLKKSKRFFLRLLPFLLILPCLAIGEAMTACAAGWDGLGWGILTTYLTYGLIGDLAGIAIWRINRKIISR